MSTTSLNPVPGSKPARVVSVPDVVLFKAFGRVLPALVLAHRFGEVSHLGSHGEPLLTVAVVDPSRESGLDTDKNTGERIYPPGRIPQVFIEHDVVHVSHVFSDEFKRQKQIQSPADVAAQRGHGEWSEFVGDDQVLIDRLRRNLGEAVAENMKNSDEANRQRARADLAEKNFADAKTSIEQRDRIIAKLQSDLTAATLPAAAASAAAPSQPAAPAGGQIGTGAAGSEQQQQ
jgi:hypothetical protein